MLETSNSGVMCMTDSDEFAEYHQAGLKTIREEQARIARLAQTAGAQMMLGEKCYLLFKEVLESLQLETLDPEQLFVAGLGALDKIESFRFVLDNLHEAIKRGESLQDTMTNYVHIGLLELPCPLDADVHNSPWASNAGSSRFLRGLWKGLKKVALVVMEVMTQAIKAVPKWIALKPAASIGMTGVFPSFELEFELAVETKEVTIHEIFQNLRSVLN
jgi:hypothetical protein